MKIIKQIQPFFLYCLTALSPLTETIYSTSLPKIAQELNTDGGIAQLATTAYYIGFSLGVLTLGRISDIYGRRPILLLGVLFYIIATFLISLSSSIEIFILLRFLQAYGASVGSVIAQSMIRDSYKGWELSYVYASVAIVIAIMPSIGSTIGGFIISYYEKWEYAFRFLVFLNIVLFSIYLKFIPETNPYIDSARSNNFLSVLKVAITDKKLISYALIIGFVNGISFSFYIQGPFIFIDRLNINPFLYGKLFFILTSASLTGGVISKFLIKKFVSTYKIKILGFSLSALGGVMLMTGSYIPIDDGNINAHIILIFGPMSIHFIGHSLLIPMFLRNALEDYGKVNGTAGSIFGSLYYLVTAMVSLMVSRFHSDTIDNYALLFIILITTSIMLFYFSTLGERKVSTDKF